MKYLDRSSSLNDRKANKHFKNGDLQKAKKRFSSLSRKNFYVRKRDTKRFLEYSTMPRGKVKQSFKGVIKIATNYYLKYSILDTYIRIDRLKPMKTLYSH